MSIRSLVEINHDFSQGLDDPEFRAALQRYLASASRDTADPLERWGLRVVGQRHHSTSFVVRADADGFPPLYLSPAEPTKGSG